MTSADQAPRGWYPDSDPTLQRWWEGTKWSDMTRPDPGPPDLRGKKLQLASVAFLTTGVVASWIAYPFIAGDAGPEEPASSTPTWASAMASLGAVSIVLCIVTFIARAVVRRHSRP